MKLVVSIRRAELVPIYKDNINYTRWIININILSAYINYPLINKGFDKDNLYFYRNLFICKDIKNLVHGTKIKKMRNKAVNSGTTMYHCVPQTFIVVRKC